MSKSASSARLYDIIRRRSFGRGDVTPEEWRDLRAEVTRNYNRGTTVRYLLGQPMLGDFLAEGLDEFGISWSDERTTPIN